MPFQNYGARRCTVAALALIGAGLMPLSCLVSAAVAQDIPSRQWYLKEMQADRMWMVSKGEGITVAVIDTGVDASLPELRGQVLDGVDTSDKATKGRSDSNGHGSNIAALIAGTGAGGGIQGLAPKAKILPVKASVFDSKEDMAGVKMATAIRYAVDHGARIANISLAADGIPKYFTDTQDAVNYALKKGVLVFAGVGNNGDKGNDPGYPAALPGVVGVGAIDRAGKVTNFSTTGDQVGLTALGDEIIEHCTETEGTCTAYGTSQATAIASASAALIWSKHPSWTNYQVLRVMMQTAARPKTGEIPSSYLGYGSIRPRKVLLDGEGNPGPADVNPLLAREGATTPDPSPSASKSASAAPGPSDSADKQAAQAPVVEPETDESNHSTLLIVVGAGIAVLVGAVVTFIVVRRRGRASVNG